MSRLVRSDQAGRKTIDVTIGVRWWLPLYLRSLIAFAQLTGQTPDSKKLNRAIARGIYVERT